MGVIDKGHTFVSGENVTADKLNNLADDATFNSDTTDNTTLEVHSTGYLKVKDAGIDTTQLADDAVTTAKIADGSITATKIASGAALVSGDNISELNNDSGYTTNAGTVTSVATGTGLTGGPITTTGTIELDTGGVGTTQLANGSVTSAKISSTDTLLNTNTAQSTIGIGALANSSSSFPKIKMDGGVQIGDQAHTISGVTPELVVSSNANTVMSVENTGTSDNAVIVIKGPSAILQLNDTDATTGTGVYNIQSAADKLRIDLILGGGSVSSLLSLDSSGNLTISGTLQENGTP